MNRRPTYSITLPAFILMALAWPLLLMAQPQVDREIVIRGPGINQPDRNAGEDKETAERKDDSAKSADEKAEGDGQAELKPAAKQKLGPQFVRLHLSDGSIVAGNLSTRNLTVATEFGLLSIPVDKIKAFRPGLSSYTTLRARLKKMVDDLGADEYATRQLAHRELSMLGMKIKNVILEYSADGNAERKRHLEEIRKEIQEQSEELFDEDEQQGFDDRPWIENDEIVTHAFTIIGKIQEDQFSLKSKYGELKVSLNDVSFGDRPTAGKPEINKKISVDGSQIAQTSFKSTTIRVEEGDVVTIRAEGSIVMTPWGSNEMCGPNGKTNYGWYLANEIEAGALVARIGSSGKIFKVGEKLRFVSKKSGTLSFAIGMNPDYSNGYSYPGTYKLKLRIQPK